MSSLLHPFSFSCPWCWENIECLADLSQETQSYIEDCQVCCHPIQISFTVTDGGITNLAIEREM